MPEHKSDEAPDSLGRVFQVNWSLDWPWILTLQPENKLSLKQRGAIVYFVVLTPCEDAAPLTFQTQTKKLITLV